MISDLLLALQRDVPLERRPFACLGEALGLDEAAVIDAARECFANGTARRFGAVFDGRLLGYASTLCAVAVPTSEIEETAAHITPLAGVTHCYERDGIPNLWFTLTAERTALVASLEALAARLAPLCVRSLPARRIFKIEAVFGGGAWSNGAARPVTATSETPPRILSRCDHAIVRLLQGSLPLVSQPFDWVAEQLAVDPNALLARCRRWRETGVIRRIGLVLRHRELGLTANSMCVWAAPAELINTAGRMVAASPFVSHCYERPSFPDFPYTLYAMLHAKTRAAAIGACAGITAAAALPPGRMLWSQREFKKTSPVYFEVPKS